RFHRVDPSRTRQGEGAGLGLAITRSIAEAHGGSVEAQSADGTTRFTLCLPRLEPESTSMRNEPRGPDADQSSNYQRT
ncbi:MAG TPA: ATP-binding protein, partial [Rhodocyclaceae bacterium]|nr:ATP-binding protein [Rhodocyclaceae bacterium]